MAHNCNTYNDEAPNAAGAVSVALLTGTVQRLSMTRPVIGAAPANFTNGMRFPFANSNLALEYSDNITSITATNPNTPITSNSFTQAYTINASGTYLLKANTHYTATSGAIITLRWKDTLGNYLGPKTRHITAPPGKNANIVWGLVSFTGSSRTVFVEVSEEAGNVQTGGLIITTTLSYSQILQLA